MPGRLLPLRVYYFASFAALGAYAPFFPRWLEARGVEGLSMGVVTGLLPAMGVLGPPAIGLVADALGLRGSILPRRLCRGVPLPGGASPPWPRAAPPRSPPSSPACPRLRGLPLADGDARRRGGHRARPRRRQELRRDPPLGLGGFPRRGGRCRAHRRSPGSGAPPRHRGGAAPPRLPRRPPPPAQAGRRAAPGDPRRPGPRRRARLPRLPRRLGARPDRPRQLRPLLLPPPARSRRPGRDHQPRLGDRRGLRGGAPALRGSARRTLRRPPPPRPRPARRRGALGAPRLRALPPRAHRAPAAARRLVRALVGDLDRLHRAARPRARAGRGAGPVHRLGRRRLRRGHAGVGGDLPGAPGARASVFAPSLRLVASPSQRRSWRRYGRAPSAHQAAEPSKPSPLPSRRGKYGRPSLHREATLTCAVSSATSDRRARPPSSSTGCASSSTAATTPPASPSTTARPSRSSAPRAS